MGCGDITLLTMRQYKRERRFLNQTKKSFQKLARECNDQSIYDNWYDEHLWEFERVEAFQKHFRSQVLVRQAHKLHVHVPPQGDLSHWEKGIDNIIFLTNEGT